MLSLNIVPRSLKKEIKLKVIYLKLKNFLFMILLMATFYLITILVSQLVLELHQITTIHEATVAVKTDSNYSRQVRNINSQVDFINKIQSNTVNWSYLLEYIDQSIGNNLDIYQIKADKTANKLTINGFAKSRDSLISFKKILENAPFLDNINFPISNILEKDDITFEISATIINYEFE